jgi:hypothetical protein
MADSQGNPPPMEVVLGGGSVWKQSSWFIPNSLKAKIMLAICIAVPLNVAGWLLQNFLQLRGVMSLIGSRIVLGFLWISLFLVCFILTYHVKRASLWRVLCAVLLLFVVCGLDVWAPKPKVPTLPLVFSSELSQSRRTYIDTTLQQVMKHLTDVGFQTGDMTLPSVAITHNNFCGGSVYDSRNEALSVFLVCPDAKEDAMRLPNQYINYFFMKSLGVFQADLDDHSDKLFAAWVLSDYFYRDYLNRFQDDRSLGWGSVLSEFRQRFGKEQTNTVMFRVYLVLTTAKTGGPFNAYFREAMERALGNFDSDGSQRALLKELVKKNEIDRD